MVAFAVADVVASLSFRDIPRPSFPLAEERDVGRSDDRVSKPADLTAIALASMSAGLLTPTTLRWSTLSPAAPERG
jgi:hypothetical protein